MKTLIIIALLISFSCSTKLETKRSVSISEFGWVFQVSADTKFKDSAFDASGNITQPFRQAGTAESVYLFTIRYDSTNWFNALAVKDTVNFNNWENYHSADNKWYFEQISLNPNIQILDTTYSTQIIGGIKFKSEHIKYYSKKRNKILSDYHYFGKFKRYELAINFTFSDETVGKKYFDILKSSKFDN